MSPAVELVEAERSGLARPKRRSTILALLLALVVGAVGAGVLGDASDGAGDADLRPVPLFAPTACSNGDLLGDSRVARIESDAQQNFLGQLNALRRSKDLGSLAWNAPITDPAIEWSETMSIQIPPGGSASDPGWLHHARDTGDNDGVSPSQDYVTINSKLVKNWTRLAENVGVGTMRQSCTIAELETNTKRIVDALHDAFVESPSHFRNMVGDHNQVGIGVHIDPDELWVTVRFANGDLPEASEEVSRETVQYISAAHELFLGRAATSAEQNRWGSIVQSGARSEMTISLAVSDAWTGVRVSALYRKILGRSADSSGRAYWVDQVARGLQLESAAAEFYGSPEYFSRKGGTNDAYIRALYVDLLGRTADEEGVAYWRRAMASGMPRQSVAANFYASIESRSDRVSQLWGEIIGGAPSQSVRAAWAERLRSLGDVRMAAELAATNLYYDRVVS